jgi:hypothetical protein
MRFKLVLLTSLIASMFGVGFSIVLILATFGASELLTNAPLGPASGRWLYLALLLPPLLVAVLGGIFAYRHTANRRKLQAFLTGILVLLFCFAEFIALERFLAFAD